MFRHKRSLLGRESGFGSVLGAALLSVTEITFGVSRCELNFCYFSSGDKSFMNAGRGQERSISLHSTIFYQLWTFDSDEGVLQINVLQQAERKGRRSRRHMDGAVIKEEPNVQTSHYMYSCRN